MYKIIINNIYGNKNMYNVIHNVAPISEEILFKIIMIH